MRAAFHPTEPRLFVTSGNQWLSYRLPEKQADEVPQTGAPERILLPDGLVPLVFSFSADGKRAAIVGVQSRLAVVDFGPTNRVTFLEGTAPVQVQAGPGSVTGSGALAMSPDGRWVAMGRNSRDTKTTVWDTGTGRIARQFNTDATHVVFCPDGRRLIAVGARQWSAVETGTWKTPARAARGQGRRSRAFGRRLDARLHPRDGQHRDRGAGHRGTSRHRERADFD